MEANLSYLFESLYHVEALISEEAYLQAVGPIKDVRDFLLHSCDPAGD